jgi:hypothetical protein
VSVISVFDGDPSTLFDGWIGMDRVPDLNECPIVLAAVKDASRRWRVRPEDGPSLTAAGRDGHGNMRSGRKNARRRKANKRME